MYIQLEEKIKNNSEFQNIIKDLIQNETVQKMKSYRQHFEINCFEHCLTTAYYCYTLCKKWHLDYVSVSRATMLHDLFLYDWRKKNNRKGFHAFTHGKLACTNACQLFSLNEKEKNMICSHMWPVTFFCFPKSLEGFILTFVDKYCATMESLSSIYIRFLQSQQYLGYLFLQSFLANFSMLI